MYLSEHVSTAVLESLVHLKKSNGLYPNNYQLLTIEAEEGALLEHVPPDQLTHGWEETFAVTQVIGDVWLKEQRSALLRVPSVVAAESWNVLLNPLHPEAARVKIERTTRHAYDRRLFLIRS